MRYIAIIILLVLCLTLLLLTGCMINTVTPEIASGNFGNQEDIYQSSNNSQNSSTDPIYKPGTEEPVIEEDTEEPGTVYPQDWATGAGTSEDPWAGDCLNDALTACPAGGTIYLRAGYYTLSSTFRANKAINLIGEGMGKTFIVLDIESADGFQIVADYCTIKGFTVDADSQIDATLIVVFNINHDYLVMEDIEVMNGGYMGISPYQNNHSLFQNIYAHDNYDHGIHPGTDTPGRGLYNTYRDIYCWDNGHGGFDDRGAGGEYPIEQSNNVYDNIQCWDNGGHGIAIGGQKGITLSNSFASGNGYQGIYLYTMEDYNVSNCSATLNGYNGLWVRWSDNVNLTNIISKNNDAYSSYAGIGITDCNDVKITSSQSYDDRETPLQSWGVSLEGVNTEISLLNCKLTPNAILAIYNPAGAVVTVITDKMLAKL